MKCYGIIVLSRKVNNNSICYEPRLVKGIEYKIFLMKKDVS
jgi:hypothetical protein